MPPYNNNNNSNVDCRTDQYSSQPEYIAMKPANPVLTSPAQHLLQVIMQLAISSIYITANFLHGLFVFNLRDSCSYLHSNFSCSEASLTPKKQIFDFIHNLL